MSKISKWRMGWGAHVGLRPERQKHVSKEYLKKEWPIDRSANCTEMVSAQRNSNVFRFMK